MENRERIWNCYYMGIFAEDGKLTDMGFSDGVGFCGSEEEPTIRNLYEFLHEYYTREEEE